MRELLTFKTAIGIQFGAYDNKKLSPHEVIKNIDLRDKSNKTFTLKWLILSNKILTQIRDRKLYALGSILYNVFLLLLVLLAFNFVYFNLFYIDSSLFSTNQYVSFLDFIFFTLENINIGNNSIIVANSNLVRVISIFSILSNICIIVMPLIFFNSVTRGKYLKALNQIILTSENVISLINNYDDEK